MSTRVFRGIYISISLHLLLWALLLHLPKPPPVDAPITFEVLAPPAPHRPHQEVVRADEVPEKYKRPIDDELVHMLAEKTQRVKEQLRAMQSGLTKNRSNLSKTESRPKNQEQNRPQDPSKAGMDRFMPGKIAMPNPQQEADNQERGTSTYMGDPDHDFKVGDITALDTDRYLFYSYFVRAQELLYNDWAPMVESVLTHPPPSLKSNSQRTLVTSLEVWFYPNGKLHSTHILKPSGVPELDYIAANTFHRVGFIPNPPREKIEADGLIRFQWNVGVRYDPRSWSRNN